LSGTRTKSRTGSAPSVSARKSLFVVNGMRRRSSSERSDSGPTRSFSKRRDSAWRMAGLSGSNSAGDGRVASYAARVDLMASEGSESFGFVRVRAFSSGRWASAASRPRLICLLGWLKSCQTPPR
jgi:hypothetical protein